VIAQTESQLQRAVVDLLVVYERQGKLRYYAVPNGGKRDPVTQKNLKLQGQRNGVPDLVILFPKLSTRVREMSLYWELKGPSGRLSDEQMDWRDWLKSSGFMWMEIRDADDAAVVLAGLLASREHLAREAA